MSVSAHLRGAWWHFRSGLMWWLLARAFTVAPEPEKTMLAVHLQRMSEELDFGNTPPNDPA